MQSTRQAADELDALRLMMQGLKVREKELQHMLQLEDSAARVPSALNAQASLRQDTFKPAQEEIWPALGSIHRAHPGGTVSKRRRVEDWGFARFHIKASARSNA